MWKMKSRDITHISNKEKTPITNQITEFNTLTVSNILLVLNYTVLHIDKLYFVYK